MITALQTYILDLQNGTCKGEEYYLELEKEQVIYSWENGASQWDGEDGSEQYFNETYKNDK